MCFTKKSYTITFQDMLRYNLNYLLYAFSLFLLIFSTGSKIKTVELINNGDFESSTEKWKEQIASRQRHDKRRRLVINVLARVLYR